MSNEDVRRNADMKRAILYGDKDPAGIPGIADEARQLWMAKNEGYGQMPGDFGSKAEVIELRRKYGKLHRALWDGLPIGGESVEEVAMDMIGHLYQLIWWVRQENNRMAEIWDAMPDGPEPGDVLTTLCPSCGSGLKQNRFYPEPSPTGLGSYAKRCEDRWHDGEG